jgi:spore coat protein A
MKLSFYSGLLLVFCILLFASIASALPQHVLDYDGDGKTDFTVIRNAGGIGSSSTWFVMTNGPFVFSATQWGISSDTFIDGDFDGDHRSDFAVWRPGSPSYFYVLRSTNATLMAAQFGTFGDDPTVVGDYDGDGTTDFAVYRDGATAGQPSYWYYLSSINGSLGALQWGISGDFPAPGDYDGDHMADVAVQRNAGGGAGVFFIRNSTGGTLTTEYFGNATDFIVPGDYDGDGKTDIAVSRSSGGNYFWYYDPSSMAGVQAVGGPWGTSATDFRVQGDYDGDGKTDFAVWRESVTPGTSAFYVNKSTGGLLSFAFGQSGDYPPANFNVH